MTAVASTTVMNGSHDSEETSADHSPSRFTAVNGRELPGPATGTTVSASEEHRETSENLGRSGYDTPSRQGERVQENGNGSNDQEDRRSRRSSSQCGPSTANRNKRKRSVSDGRQETPQASYQTPNIPRSPVSRLDDTLDPHTQSTNFNHVITSLGDNETRNPSSSAPPRPDGNEGSRTPSTNGPWHDFDSQLISQAQRAQQIDSSDAQLAAVLQREAHGHDTTPKHWGAVNRPSEGSMQGDESPSVASYPSERTQAAVQVAPKRKRVFSNRTKTGCMTCRRRKKKCDEQRPACNNCVRGGFLCEGYNTRSTWQKPSGVKTPVPLQSKEGYSDISGQYLHDLGQQHDRPQNLSEQIDAGKMRPVAVDDGDRGTSQYNTSPTGVGANRAAWPKQTWPGTGHPNFISDHIAKSDYREVPPIHELPREGPPKNDYQVVPSIRELSHGAPPKSGMPLLQGGIDQRPTPNSSLDTSSPQAQARMALSIEHQLSTRTASGEETEKEKMICGKLYRPFDVHLVEERDRCKAALWRFNNSCNPVSGVSTKEQNRLLKEILVPTNVIIGSPTGVSSRSTGSIGQGAVVEAPFHCHYGYNIHIGEDVMISESCLFVDDCAISIGAHTWIGPKVTILSSMAFASMQERKGSQSRYQGRPVTIEEDCYIGAGCTIYPGVRLRRGAYVAPGEVVKSDIVAYGFQGLKPGYM